MKRTILTAAWLLAGALVCSAFEPAFSATSQTWIIRDRDAFHDAKFEGVSMAADGSLLLSAQVTRLFEARQSNVWALVRDSQGRLYAGGGNDGKVQVLEREGTWAEVVFDADEPEVHALAVDSKDRLYVGTSPDGAVYRVEEGIPVTIFDPQEKYIWAMGFDGKDRLWVATGLSGRVYRVDSLEPNSSGKVVHTGQEDHIRNLVKAPDGGFYAGSDQNGILYYIADDGTSTVVYDSPMREIAGLAVSSDGEMVYLATLAPAPRRGSGLSSSRDEPGVNVTSVRVTTEGGNGQSSSGNQQQTKQPRPSPPERYVGAVYSVTRDGFARKLWESRETMPHSIIVLNGDGAQRSILVGTGNEGRVILLNDQGDASDYVSVPSGQVTAMIAGDGDRVYVGASNLGQVVGISPGESKEGTITSATRDAGYTSAWGTLSWSADVSRGAAVSFEVRTGDSEIPDERWSEWSKKITKSSGELIDAPKGRFLQWRARLSSASGARGPVIRSISIGYLQDNLPPIVTGVSITEPGVVLAGGANPQQDGGDNSKRGAVAPRRSFERGQRSASWVAEDVNDDRMKYDVFFKAEDETSWKPLATGLETQFHTWDENLMPDGVYRLHVVVTDAPSNPPDKSLSGARTSDAFDVDNTPPQVGSIAYDLRTAEEGNREADLKVTVSDSFSAIGEVAWSLDAGDWVPVLPEDLIADSRSETFRFKATGLNGGEHTVTVRATDRAGNKSAAKVVIKAADS